MNHQGNRNILAQMSILSAICENIHNCYRCEKRAELEGQPSKCVSGPASRWQREAVQDLMPCLESYSSPLSLSVCSLSVIYNAHCKRPDVNLFIATGIV